MLFRKTASISFIVCLLAINLFAQTEALQKIDTTDLKRNLTFIASDKLQGRKLGTAIDGLGITADYLAENAKRIGLKPGADNFFQKVEMRMTKPDESSFVEIQNLKGKSLYETNSLVIINRPQKTKEIETEEIIFLGFGTEKIPKLEGKIVVISQGNTKSFLQEDSYRWNNRLEQRKIERISEKKPQAIILVTNPNDNKNIAFNQINTWFNREEYSLSYKVDKDRTPVILTQAKFADKLLGGKGKLDKYLTEISEGNTLDFISIIKKKIKIQIENKSVVIEGKNVVGIVEGSDPVLKNEYVVFVAHYDHLGIGKNGDVYNGADDNGSGTVAIMEVAEAFMSMEKRPKRSIAFLWVTGEEIGHFGSQYYCDHPIFPLEKTVAAINLDMVGRVYESPRDDVWKDSPKKVKDFDGLYTLSNDVWPKLAEINATKCKELGLVPDTSLPKNPFLRASDHYYFHKNGVPILNYATGYHADYHKVGDEVSKINFEKIKRVSDLCFLVGLEVANTDHIEFTSDKE